MQALTSLAVCLSLLGAPQDSTVYFVTSSRCHYCDVVKPVVVRLMREGYRIEVVSADERPDMVRQLRVSGFPTFVRMENGQETGRVVGAQSYERLIEFAGVTAPAQPSASPQFAEVPREIPGMREIEPTPVGFPPRQGTPPTSGPAIVAISDLAERRALGATVRIKIEEADGVSFGTGVVVDVHRTEAGSEALIVTCGHLFRDSKGQARLTVDFPTRQDNQPVPGRLLDYTADDADIGVIYVTLPFAVEPVPVADRNSRPQVGEPVFSIGCDQGGPARVMKSAVSAVNRYVGPPNVEVKGAPSLGRSGGGLFDAQGRLIGICNAMDPQDDEGIYAGLPLVHWQLAGIGQGRIFENVAQAPLEQSIQQAGNVAEDMPLVRSADVRGDAPTGAATLGYQEPIPPQGAALPSSLQAVVTIRDRSRPDAAPRVVVIDGPSSQFLENLQHEQISLGQASQAAPLR